MRFTQADYKIAGMKILFFLVLVSATALYGQGTLPPPSGTPVPTMKKLDEVEARIIVNATNCPPGPSNAFVISQPGSYYLVGNITVTTGNAIKITGSNVTLDLNGFSISSTSVPASGAGVSIDIGTGQNVVVLNNGLHG